VVVFAALIQNLGPAYAEPVAFTVFKEGVIAGTTPVGPTSQQREVTVFGGVDPVDYGHVRTYTLALDVGNYVRERSETNNTRRVAVTFPPSRPAMGGFLPCVAVI
jgi:subtilase family serine protease